MQTISFQVFILSIIFGLVKSQSSTHSFIRENRQRSLQEECPDIETVQNLNITQFISATWYVQKQRVVPFQPVSSFYCIEANYNTNPNDWWSFWYGWDLEAQNYGENADGTPQEATLCVKQTKEGSSKLCVAPCFLPFAGPFWIVLYEEGEQGYAVISGGQPTIATGNGCKVPDGNGLWVFTRERNPSSDLVDQVLNMTQAKGLDVNLDDFFPVNQTNCQRDNN